MKTIADKERILVRLEGLEKLWALKTKLEIPRASISRIDYSDQKPTMKGLGGFFRFPGTSLPGAFLAGRFIKKGERDFWLLRMRQPGVLTIKLKPKTFRYDRIMLTASAKTAKYVQR